MPFKFKLKTQRRVLIRFVYGNLKFPDGEQSYDLFIAIRKDCPCC